MKRRILSLLLCLCMVTPNMTAVQFALAEEEPAIEVTIEEAAEPAAEIVIEKPAEEPTEEPVEEPTEEPAEELTEEPAEEPTEEPAEEPTEEPVEEPTEEPVEEPTEELTEEPVEEPTEEPVEEELLPEIVTPEEEEEVLIPEEGVLIPEEGEQILEGEAVLDMMDAASESWKTAPTISSITASGSNVTLKWTPGASEKKSFRIFEYVNGSPSWRATTTATSYNLTGVANGTHTYVVTPYDPSTGTYGTQSAKKSVTVGTAATGWKAAPTINRITASGNSVTLEWTAGSSEKKSFRVFEYVGNTPSWRATTTATSYTLTGVSNGTHAYVVTPYDPSTGVYGSQSAAKNVTVGADWKKPPTISSITASGSNVTLKWTPGASEKKSFRIFEYVDGTASWRATTTNTSYTLTGVTNGEHTYVVTPYDPSANVHGTQSARVSVMVNNADAWKLAPTITSITADGSNVTISWTLGAGARKSFRIFEYVNGVASWRATTTGVTYTLRGVADGEHTYVVTPYDPSTAAYGTQSAKKSVTVGSAAASWKTAPTITSITADGSSVTIQWTPGSTEKKSFRIFEYVNGVASWRATTANTSYTLTGVANGEHTYVVTPYDPAAGTHGTQSGRERVTVSGMAAWKTAPILNSVTAGGNVVALDWTPGASDVKSFRIFEYVNGKASWRATTTGTTYLLEGVAIGEHTYVVTPYDPATGTYGTQSNQRTVSVTTEKQTFEYSVTDGEAMITGYNGSDAHLVIPAEIDGYPVTTIGPNAFYGMTTLESVHFMEGSLTTIDFGAFNRCTNLKRVTLPDTLTFLGASAFVGCSALESIELPDSLTEILGSTFQSCTSLESVRFPSSRLTGIGDYAFQNCTSLRTADITANGALELGKEAFKDCAYLWNVTMKNCRVTEIPESFFENCTKLKSVTLPESLGSIGMDAFRRCSSLASIELPEGLTQISQYAFDQCYGLAEVGFPSSLTSIGSYAFRNCDALKSVDIVGSGDLGSGLCAFEDCDGLETVNISVKGSMNVPDFRDCSSLWSVELSSGTGATMSGYAFYACNSLTHVVLPDQIDDIGVFEFAYCSKLMSLRIPEGATKIGNSAFDTCSKLEAIYIPASVTTFGTYIFNNRCNALTIYGEAGSAAQTYANDNLIPFSTGTMPTY